VEGLDEVGIPLESPKLALFQRTGKGLFSPGNGGFSGTLALLDLALFGRITQQTSRNRIGTCGNCSRALLLRVPRRRSCPSPLFVPPKTDGAQVGFVGRSLIESGCTTNFRDHPAK
jgi:hypothetical protein